MENNNSQGIVIFCALLCAGAYIYFIYKSEKRAQDAHAEQKEYFKWVKEQEFPEKTNKKEKPNLTLVQTPEMDQ